jgi:hypothetical protein
VQIKGTLDDPMIQKVLSHAMVNEQNPGVRLRAVNALTSSSSPENDIKRALIITLKTDANSGVRREAFTALVKYPYDESIKDALLHVLNHDDNPGLRIEAINLLETQTQSRTQVDREMMDVLRSRIEMDDNPYIRTRARTVLEEFSNP